MSLPLKAEGEFALVKQHIEWAFGKWVGPVKWGSMPTDMDLYNQLVDMAAQDRDEDALRQYAARAEELATRYNHKLYLAIAHRSWGVAHTLAGEYSDAEKRLNQAMKTFRSLKTRWQIGRTLYELGELSLAQGDVKKARDHFTRALAAFEEMKAGPDVERVRGRLEAMS